MNTYGSTARHQCPWIHGYDLVDHELVLRSPSVTMRFSSFVRQFSATQRLVAWNKKRRANAAQSPVGDTRNSFTDGSALSSSVNLVAFAARLVRMTMRYSKKLESTSRR